MADLSESWRALGDIGDAYGARQIVTQPVDLGGPISRWSRPRWLRSGFTAGLVKEMARSGPLRQETDRARHVLGVRYSPTGRASVSRFAVNRLLRVKRRRVFPCEDPQTRRLIDTEFSIGPTCPIDAEHPTSWLISGYRVPPRKNRQQRGLNSRWRLKASRCLKEGRHSRQAGLVPLSQVAPKARDRAVPRRDIRIGRYPAPGSASDDPRLAELFGAAAVLEREPQRYGNRSAPIPAIPPPVHEGGAGLNKLQAVKPDTAPIPQQAYALPPFIPRRILTHA